MFFVLVYSRLALVLPHTIKAFVPAISASLEIIDNRAPALLTNILAFQAFHALGFCFEFARTYAENNCAAMNRADTLPLHQPIVNGDK